MLREYLFRRDDEADEIRKQLLACAAEGRQFLGHLSGPPGYGKDVVLDALEERSVLLVRLQPLHKGVVSIEHAWREFIFLPLAHRYTQAAPGESAVREALHDVYDAGRRVLSLIDEMVRNAPDKPMIVIENFEHLAKDPGVLLQLTDAWRNSSEPRAFHLLTSSAFTWNQLAGAPPLHGCPLRALPVPSVWGTPPAQANYVESHRVNHWIEELSQRAADGLKNWLSAEPANKDTLKNECLKEASGHPMLCALLLEAVIQKAQQSNDGGAAIAAARASWADNDALAARLLPTLSNPAVCPDPLIEMIADCAAEWLSAYSNETSLPDDREAEISAIGLPPTSQRQHALWGVVRPDWVKKQNAALRAEITERAKQSSNVLKEEPEVKALISRLQEHFEATEQSDLRETRIIEGSVTEVFNIGGDVRVFRLDVEQKLLDAEMEKARSRRRKSDDDEDAAKRVPLPNTYKLPLVVYTGMTDLARRIWVSQLASLRRLSDTGASAIRPVSRGGSIKLENHSWAGYVLSTAAPSTLAADFDACVELRREITDPSAAGPRPAPLPWAVNDLAAALTHLHEQGILHRRIDLGQIGVAIGEGKYGSPRLTLEGLERSMFLRAAAPKLSLSPLKQNLSDMERLFLPPEAQSLARVDADSHFVLRWASSDVYSFGVLVAVLVAGRPDEGALSEALSQIDASNALEPHEKSLQARKLPELLLDLPGWRVDPPGKMPASPWQTYVSEVRRVVTETLGDPFRRPSMENLHRKLQFASNQYKDSLDRSDEEFAVTFSTQHMASNIPRNLLEGDLDWSSERDAAILRTKIEEWIREATEIQYAPQGYTLANAFATETAERSTIMVVGPEVVFFAAYQQEGAGRTSNERLLRLNFTVNRIHVALAPVANDERVAWPRNVRVFPSSELNTATTKQAIAECKEWAPLIRKASMVAQSISADALLALATWRFHLRLSRVFKKLLDFPVNISAAGDKTQLVLDKTAFDKILDNPLCRMVFGQGHPQRFFAAELKRWHDELTAGSGKLQLRNRNSGHRFDIAIHEIKEHQVFVDAFGKRRSWPEKGVLHYAENAGVNVAHQRQEAGVGALMSNHRILRRLVDGEQHSAVRITASPELKTMQQALDNLKSSWPVSAVNGPPGTGKTTLMANLVREILEDDPAARILLTSQSHAAVDNAMERISSELELAGETSASLPLVRSFSAFTRSKVSNNSLRNHDIKAFVKRARDRAIGSAKDESSGNKSLTKARKKLHEAAEESTNEWERRIERSAPLVATTTSGASLAGDYQRSRSNRWDWVLCDEAGRAFGIELAQPMAVAQRLVLTGDYRQLPPYQIEVIEEAIKKIHSRVQNGHFDNLDMDMLRIGDSAASKDAALNWLVPFKRLMTMGDPFRPDIGSEDPGIVPVTQELSTQYRSYRAIGDLVSDAFYKGEVRTYEGEVRHGVNVSETPDEAVLPLGSGRHDPVLCWVDTSSWEDRHENRTAGLSLRNRLEAQVAAALAARLFENLERDDPDCLRDPRQLAEYIRILSPYAAQVAEIRNALERGFLKPKERLRAFRDTVLGTVGTVDSAQGAEATICIYSWVRSTPYQRIPDNDSSVAAWEAALRQQFGFLLKRERMNVLMSRAREQIVIVGDRKHFDQFMALHEGLKKAVEGSESEHTINPKEIVFWTDLLKAFDPEKDWKNGRRVIPLDELGLDP